MGVPPQCFSSSEERWVSPAASGTSVVPGHSFMAILFPYGRGCHAHIDSCMQCCFGEGRGGRAAGKILTIFTMSKFGFFCLPPTVCLNSPLGCWTSVSLRSNFLSRSVGIGQACCSAFSTMCAKVCLPITRCTRGQDSFWVPWHVVLDLTTPTQTFLFVDGCLILCRIGGTKRTILCRMMLMLCSRYY